MEKLGAVLSAIVLLAIAAIILAWPTQLLWNNALVGAVNGINPIGFWQALGINLLFGILFKNSNSK
jgi:accessory gene regulator protein AgrB